MLQDLSEAQLDREFDRLVTLRDACEASLKDLRKERADRKDREIAELRVKLAQSQ